MFIKWPKKIKLELSIIKKNIIVTQKSIKYLNNKLISIINKISDIKVHCQIQVLIICFLFLYFFITSINFQLVKKNFV